jgi:hypothetical protein
VFGEADLRRVLKAYASYYNRIRTDLALDRDAPLSRRRQTVANIVSIPILGGLHHQYVRDQVFSTNNYEKHTQNSADTPKTLVVDASRREEEVIKLPRGKAAQKKFRA